MVHVYVPIDRDGDKHTNLQKTAGMFGEGKKAIDGAVVSCISA